MQTLWFHLQSGPCSAELLLKRSLPDLSMSIEDTQVHRALEIRPFRNGPSEMATDKRPLRHSPWDTAKHSLDGHQVQGVVEVQLRFQGCRVSGEQLTPTLHIQNRLWSSWSQTVLHKKKRGELNRSRPEYLSRNPEWGGKQKNCVKEPVSRANPKPIQSISTYNCQQNHARMSVIWLPCVLVIHHDVWTSIYTSKTAEGRRMESRQWPSTGGRTALTLGWSWRTIICQKSRRREGRKVREKNEKRGEKVNLFWLMNGILAGW